MGDVKDTAINDEHRMLIPTLASAKIYLALSRAEKPLTSDEVVEQVMKLDLPSLKVTSKDKRTRDLLKFWSKNKNPRFILLHFDQATGRYSTIYPDHEVIRRPKSR